MNLGQTKELTAVRKLLKILKEKIIKELKTLFGKTSDPSESSTEEERQPKKATSLERSPQLQKAKERSRKTRDYKFPALMSSFGNS